MSVFHGLSAGKIVHPAMEGCDPPGGVAVGADVGVDDGTGVAFGVGEGEAVAVAADVGVADAAGVFVTFGAGAGDDEPPLQPALATAQPKTHRLVPRTRRKVIALPYSASRTTPSDPHQRGARHRPELADP